MLNALEPSFAADLAWYLKRWIISDFCLRYNFKRVLLATTGHKVASLLLGALAKGRGSSIYNEVAHSDNKNFGGRVAFCNPMKEFLHKEIALFNHLNKVEIISQQPLAKLRNTGKK